MKRLISFFAAATLLSGTAVYGQFSRTEALADSAWESSEWISAKDATVIEGIVADRNNSRAADGASWFLSNLTNEKKVVSARWMVTSLGVFDIFINGKPVGDEALRPGFTHPLKTRRSFTYDVTGMLDTRKGASNTLSAQVTPGWWADKIVTPRKHEGMLGRKCAFRAVLELKYEDGTTSLLGTGTKGWKAGIAGPVTHAAIFDGEEYDARIKPGYSTPELLGEPEINDEFKGEILPSDGAEVCWRKDLAMRPQKAYVWEGVNDASKTEYGRIDIKREYADGSVITLDEGETLVIDFGQNAAAVPAFTFKAKEGTVVTCLTAELVNDGNGAKSRGMDGPEGSIHRTNLRNPSNAFRMVYTFGKGGRYVTYQPRYTFFGYRYISVTATGKVSIKSIASIPVTSIKADLETGILKTGDESINKLISNTVWGQRSNYLSVPTDCPQRNERLGWTADTQVFTQTGAYFANTDAFFHKWMRDMRDSQSPTGAFPGVAPTAQYGENMMRLGWADAGIIVPWTIWKQFADTAIIEENWDSMDRFITHMAETRYDHDALKEENGNYQWADWLSFEPLESHGGGAFIKDASGARRPAPETLEYWRFLSSCYWVLDAEMMRDMAAASGRDAARFEAMAREAREYAGKRFFKADGSFKCGILNTMQTPALFALKTGLVEGAAREATIARLRENFNSTGMRLQTGFLGTSILMDTLTENDMADIAWNLLFQRENPSWLYSVDNGATTIWERWNSYTKEHGMGPKGMNSFNHYAYGCVCAWIWKTVAGIAADPEIPGFRHIIMSPVPDRRLGSMEASYLSAAGPIRSSWRYDGDTWIWNFSIPEGASAAVTLPDGSPTMEYGPGDHEVSIPAPDTRVGVPVPLASSPARPRAGMKKLVERNLDFAAQQGMLMYEAVKDLPGELPNQTDMEGKFVTCKSKAWVSGFHPGLLWYIYENTGDEKVLAAADDLTRRLEEEQYNPNSHDIGFVLNCSYGNGYRLTRNEEYRQVLINGANSLATRFNPTVGCTRSWRPRFGWDFVVIIDNMMNLELLTVGSRLSGDPANEEIARTHANTTNRNHFRADGSSVHVLDYDEATGRINQRITRQGLSDDSAWARGQGWGLYGFTMMYRETGDRAYLERACRIADYIASHPNLPKDKIPYWDFYAPASKATPRDASAGALIASALIELSQYTEGRKSGEYLSLAEKMLKSLSSKAYRAAKPGDNSNFILRHATVFFKNNNYDTALTYADYYYVEALMRYKRLLEGRPAVELNRDRA